MMMRGEDWFELALRVIGVVLFIYGMGYLLDSLLFRLGYFSHLDSTPGYYLIVGLSSVFVGLCLIRGAPYFVGFGYGDEEGKSQTEDEHTPPQDI